MGEWVTRRVVTGSRISGQESTSVPGSRMDSRYRTSQSSGTRIGCYVWLDSSGFIYGIRKESGGGGGGGCLVGGVGGGGGCRHISKWIVECSKLNQKSCQSCCLESQIINMKLKKSFKNVPSPPPKLSASSWRTGSNLEHCCEGGLYMGRQRPRG